MSPSTIPEELRDFVIQRAAYRCEYCQTPMWLTGIPHEIDHITPRAKNGTTTEDNLCLACSSCNGFKHSRTHGQDPGTKQEVALFHPRQQVWFQHFVWSEVGTHIVGLTPCGRATIELLRLNHDLIVTARAIWVSAGYHPPR
jgi:HNH endonuclease